MQIDTSISDSLQRIWPWSGKGTASDRNVIAEVNGLASEYRRLSKVELRELAARLRCDQALESRADKVMALAVFKEAVRRATGIVYYDVQLLAALAMTRRTIAEMATGEGKTYVGALASFLYGLSGKGVHFMTTNSYLAERDYQWVAPMFHEVGLTIGLLSSEDDPSQKKAAYDCDVTYGPGYEFGFDYLRDQLTLRSRPKPQLGQTVRDASQGRSRNEMTMIQRGHAVAIVDEADSVFLDEANTPLLLSGPAEKENPYPGIYRVAWNLAVRMTEQQDYVFSPARIPKLTERGSAGSLMEFDKLGDIVLRRPWTEYVEQALFALTRLKKDVHYIVVDDQVNIVDDFTGRIFADRTWQGGLHQIVEAKEGVTITAESQPLACISRQQFFQLYERLCGMTGTARGSERELSQFYRISVAAIPTRKPCIRHQLPSRYFATASQKWEAITTEVARIHELGQPVLIGTRTIESSEALAFCLTDKRVPFQLLNGKQDAEEAGIVARAGQRGRITVATNMAGRGTDIKLADGVTEVGGLHVIVAEPHDSRRIDRQLMGRAARQGDPGSCQCFASADDELISVHAPWLANHMRDSAAANGEVPDDLGKTIARVQQKVEQLDYAKRRRAFNHDAWLENVTSELAETDPA